MIDKEIIKTEIERLKKAKGFLPIEQRELTAAYWARGYQEACDDFSSFIKSLQEKPVSKDLEQEVKRYVYDPYFDLNGVAIKGATAYLTVEDVADIARHFAQWQREHVWHDPDDIPSIERKIMWEDENFLGKRLSTEWTPKRDVFGRKERWCYVGDILPRSKRKED